MNIISEWELTFDPSGTPVCVGHAKLVRDTLTVRALLQSSHHSAKLNY